MHDPAKLAANVGARVADELGKDRKP